MTHKTNVYELKYRIPKHYVRIISKRQKKADIDNLSVSFPFAISASFKFEGSIIDIAKETIITLIDRRILNSKECCANCINKSIDSLKEIKSDLINIKNN